MRRKFFLIFFLFIGILTLLSQTSATRAAGLPPIKTVFVIVMENHNWSEITASNSPFTYSQMVAKGAHAENYISPSNIHPSLPNYLLMEAGTNFGLNNDSDPSVNHQSTTAHLVTQLKNAGVSWKGYFEGVPGTDCPLTDINSQAVHHNPFVYFDDVTNNLSRTSSYCISHIRPFTELASDLANNTVSSYNFIVPNVCNDTHNCSIQTGDTWISNIVPLITASAAYKNGGVIFLTWDEDSTSNNAPIGMIAVSPFAKANYQNSILYTHNSLLRTVEEIFGVSPFLGGAASANDLSDFFTSSGGTPFPTSTPVPTPTPTPTPGPSGTGVPTPTPLGSICQKLFIPAYFAPGSLWTTADNNASKIFGMIMNPASGPGTSASSSYVSAVNTAKSAGMRVYGYVHTSYGTRSSATVKAEIDDYKNWYGVTDIFLDEAAADTANLAYYQDVDGYIHQNGGLVTLNPGTTPAEQYMSVADSIVNFEGTASSYQSASFPSWIANYPASRFVHLVYAASSSSLSSILSLSSSRHAGYLYVTDDVAPNPWDTLPTYLTSELSGLNCSGSNNPKPGDANGDGVVNEADYSIWLSHYGQNVAGASNGDFNNDGKVDGVDFVIWLNNTTA